MTAKDPLDNLENEEIEDESLENKSVPDEDQEHDFDGSDVDLDEFENIDPLASENHSGLGEGERVIDYDDDDDYEPPQEDLPDSTELFEETNLIGDAQDIKTALEQRDSYLEALRQLQADFENYKKRILRDQEEYAASKNDKLIEDMLPILDNFSLAISSLESEDETVIKLKKGVELVFNDLLSLLEKQGLEKINAQGELFDPEVHDAVLHEDNDEHDHEIVVEVMREGYKVRGRVIRPAMVKVAK